MSSICRSNGNDEERKEYLILEEKKSALETIHVSRKKTKEVPSNIFVETGPINRNRSRMGNNSSEKKVLVENNSKFQTAHFGEEEEKREGN
mmetsp:Transcript_4901/g.4523  ORF Transcript_4901/g.4523 Transcript_4901/m.4523 type:complete len:91 (+) Transcript_4901:1110-1382(+)